MASVYDRITQLAKMGKTPTGTNATKVSFDNTNSNGGLVGDDGSSLPSSISNAIKAKRDALGAPDLTGTPGDGKTVGDPYDSSNYQNLKVGLSTPTLSGTGVPQQNAAAKAAAELKQITDQNEARRPRGRTATLLTGSDGLLGSPSVSRRSLMAY